ncbi:hypothetical protein [Streptomyces roseicoloratus]|uniref:Uncharacterized protein n=1 Tax=Streptomyces roseicoloratus TaxID=2508722 RepID=A0ABY9S3U3_9ACTN|nr:hypothetical protein [Streptomyces roseicoloratus]WMX48613.1 hypothetical protein RGF97_32745 [Streptomyces roseicoloratus]
MSADDALPDDVVAAVGLLLDGEDPVHAALRRQVPHLRVAGRCACGCGTTDFAVDTAAAPAAPTGDPGTRSVASRIFCAADGTVLGDVVLFARGGHLSWIEVCDLTGIHDDVTVTLDLALRCLTRPADDHRSP